MKEKKIIENLLITDIADKGQALGKSGEKVIFVNKAVPGDVVDVWITKSRKNYLEGRVKEIKVHSPYRVDPFCSHFGICGGCKWQDMDYERQLLFKHKQVVDAMHRIAKAENIEIQPIDAAPETRYYRNKLEFAFSSKRWLDSNEIKNKEIMAENGLGFHIPGRFDKILDIEKCFLQPWPSNEIRLAVKYFAIKNSYDFFDPVTQNGFLRNMVIRTANTGEVMVVVVFHYYDPGKINALMEYLSLQFEQITSLFYIINAKKNDITSDLPVHHFRGKDHILEKMENLLFKVGPKSFFQTNSTQALKLYRISKDLAGLTGGEILYDLYCGTGTIANFVASESKKVIGVEFIQEAIEDARSNAALNGIENISFFAGDMKDVLSESFFIEHGKPDVIIVDPPRAGMQQSVIDSLLKTGAQKIVYISCNPSTQARDMLLLAEKYEGVVSCPVDMFPHTHHVENVVLLMKK